MTYVHSHLSAPKSRRTASNTGLAMVLRIARALVRRHLERRALYDLLGRPDYQLRDVGLDRDDVRAALTAPFRHREGQD